MKMTLLIGMGITLVMSGCANQNQVGVQKLGGHVAQIKTLQTYNPNATQENMAIIPDGNGERMEDAYSIYTGKKSEDLKGSSTSQIITGF